MCRYTSDMLGSMLHIAKCCRSRQAQLAEKQERKTAEKAAEAAFARAWVKQLQDLQEEEVMGSPSPSSSEILYGPYPTQVAFTPRRRSKSVGP